MIEWWPRLVARVKTSIHVKLMVAFLVIIALMLVSGVVGLAALSEVNQRTADMVQLQRKIAAYRQLNHDTISQLYSVASALLKPEDRRLDATLRQLNQFGYDLDRLQFVAQDEVELLRRVRGDYEEFIAVVTQAIQLIREGKPTAGRDLQLSRATPLADRLERLTNELVNRAEAEMVTRVEINNAAYGTSMRTVAFFAIVSIVLALTLGYGISVSLIGPVRAMEKRMLEIAAGEFSHNVEVPNRDELGVLATDLNSMSERLGSLYHELEESNQHKSEFLANMSHELRTPLNAVIGFSEVLEQKMFGELNEKQMEYVQDIHASGRHLLSLINDILDLSKLDIDVLEVSRFNLRTTIEATLTLVRERAARHGLQINLTLDERLGEIEADERRVRQILLNLLSNAVKFTPDGGHIDIGATIVDDAVQISVRDTGVGIDEDDQDKIFDRFQQGSGNHAGKREGTGLGLTLARKLAELHKGRIEVRSKVGEGSTFCLTLPLMQSTAPALADHSPAANSQEETKQWAAN